MVLDTGAAMGIVDGIQFALDGNPELDVHLTEISEKKIFMLKECGLPKSVVINNYEKGLSNGDNPNFKNKEETPNPNDKNLTSG